MNHLASSKILTRTFPRTLIPALSCALVLTACERDDSLGSTVNRDAAPDHAASPVTPTVPDATPTVPDASAPAEESGCSSKYPSTSRVDDAGVTQWWWFFDWKQVPELATVCSTYGADAKIVLEVTPPKNPAASASLPECSVDEILRGAARACAIAGSYRFEAACTAGELLLELPSETTFHGYYHVEGSLVTAAKRVMVNQDPHCSRNVYAPAYSSPLPAFVDAGVLSPDDADAPSKDAGVSTPDAGNPDGWTLGTCRLIPSGNPIPTGGSCSSTVTQCQAGATEVCGATPIENTVAAAVAACGVYCGNIAVGFSAGCATTIMEYTPLSTIAPVTHDQGLACVRDLLFGSRFACVPTDGWDNLYLGSCTIP